MNRWIKDFKDKRNQLDLIRLVINTYSVIGKLLPLGSDNVMACSVAPKMLTRRLKPFFLSYPFFRTSHFWADKHQSKIDFCSTLPSYYILVKIISSQV
jgi:hypothetical protein